MKTADPAAPRLRTVPVQARARETVESILGAAAELLAENGPEALTTSALSARTGLHVRNVYRYFPDRLAVFAALAERLNARVEAAIGDLGGLADPGSDWRRELHRLLEALVTVASVEPALVQIRSALRSSPELQSIELASDRRIAAVIADALHRRGARGGRKRLELRALVVVTAMGAVLDRILLDADLDRAVLLREVETLAASYLATLLERSPG